MNAGDSSLCPFYFVLTPAHGMVPLTPRREGFLPNLS